MKNIDTNYLRLLPVFLFLLGSVTTINIYAQVYAEAGFMEFQDTTILPDFIDGPHVQWSDNKKAQTLFFKYDSTSGKVSAERLTYRVKPGGRYIRDYDYGPKNFFLEGNYPYQPGIIKTNKKILVIGDVHGEYLKLVEVLKNFGLIDSRGNWVWGMNQLVFLGDFMDRGSMVTETLWFIKKIQHQAQLAGGAVHLILGNHEIMNLNGDHRYLNYKYRLICEKLGIDYYELFSNDMDLGRWLRSLNTALLINDNLFVHGGFSPEFLQKRITIDSLNNLIHKMLRGEISPENFDLLYFLTDNKGPFWYRGFLSATPEYPKLETGQLQEALDFYGAKRIIYGHTENKTFQIDEGGKLIGIDVPFRFTGYTERALLIEGENIYRVYNDGAKEMIGK